MRKQQLFSTPETEYGNLPKQKSDWDRLQSMRKFREKIERRPALPEGQWHISTPEETEIIKAETFQHINNFYEDEQTRPVTLGTKNASVELNATIDIVDISKATE